MKRLLLDTNVTLDYLLMRSNYQSAKDIIDLSINNDAFECLTATTVTDIHYLAGKNANPKMDSYEVQAKIEDLLKIIDVLPVLKEDIANALKLRWKDMEDALQYCVAVANGIDCIITNNVKDFEASDIEILAPQDFLEKYAKNGEND